MPRDSEHRADRYSLRLILSLPAGILLALFLALAIHNSFLCDDAFITFRYARNLASDLGPVFNPGERVEGYTNFLWMILMAVVFKLGGTPELWSRVLSILFSIGTVIVFLHHISARHRDRLLAFLFPAFLAFSAPFFVWSTGGLETAAFTFFTVGAFTSLLRACDSSHGRLFLISSLFFLVAALTRPEGVMLFALALVYVAVLAIQRRISATSFLLFLIPFFVSYGIYFLWRWDFYGKLMPNTYYIKTPGFESIRQGLQYYARFVIRSSVWIPAALVAHRLIRTRFRALNDRSLFMLTVLLTYSLYVVFTGGDFMALSRFMVPLLPVVYLLSDDLIRSSGLWLTTGKQRAAVGILLALFVAANIYASQHARKVWHTNGIDSIGMLIDYADKWTDIGHLMRQNSLPTDTLATTAAGIIPYYSGLYTIDILGLVASNISGYRGGSGANRPGHSMHIDPDYLLKLRPQFLIGHPRISGEERRGFNLGVLASRRDEALKYYSPVSLELPNYPGSYLHLWLRKDVAARIRKVPESSTDAVRPGG